MKVFVTGGGGFLGYAIVLQLLEKKYEIHTYSRSKYKKLEGHGIHQHEGNLTDYNTLKTAMEGCDAVFHVAAKTGIQGDYSSFYRTNVTGTENILKACSELNIPHMIYTSSASVVFSNGSEGMNESMPYPSRFDAYYPQTKAIAEALVLNASGGSLITCSLRPHLVWGPGDIHFIPRLLEKRSKNKLRRLGTKKYLVDVTYVDNAAKAHLQAFEAMLNHPDSVAGKAYFLSQDEPIAVHEFIDRLLESGGLQPVQKTLNLHTARIIGWLMDRVVRLFRLEQEPPLTLFIAKQLTSSHWYDISASKKDFGYKPSISIDKGMRQLKKWCKHEFNTHS